MTVLAKGHAERVLTPHSVEVVNEVKTQTSAGGTKTSWIRSGRLLDCQIEPVRADDQTALSQPQTRATYRLRFFANPTLLITNRLWVRTPSWLLNKVLRAVGLPLAPMSEGWMWELVCQEYSEDPQPTVS